MEPAMRGFPRPRQRPGSNNAHRDYYPWGRPPFPNYMVPGTYSEGTRQPPRKDPNRKNLEMPQVPWHFHRTMPMPSPRQPPPQVSPRAVRLPYMHRSNLVPLGYGSRWATRSVNPNRSSFWDSVSSGSFGRTKQPNPWVIEELAPRSRFEKYAKRDPIVRESGEGDEYRYVEGTDPRLTRARQRLNAVDAFSRASRRPTAA